MTTTELLVHSGVVTSRRKNKSDWKLGNGIVVGLLVGLVCFVSASAAYTYQQYSENTKEKVAAASSPLKLNSADLVLPIHK